MPNYYRLAGFIAVFTSLWSIAVGAESTMTERRERISAKSLELPFTPVLLDKTPRPRSPCWYRNELWVLAGWSVRESYNDNREPVARFDGERWRFYTLPLTNPDIMVCDGRTMLVAGETAGKAVAYFREAGQWQVALMPDGGSGNDEFRFAGGAAIVAYTARAMWQWHDRAWRSIPWRAPDADTVLARVIPETAKRWFVVAAVPRGHNWDLAYAHFLPLASDRKKAQKQASKMAKDLDRIWDLVRANDLPRARARLNALLARYPHDGQLLFCDARLTWREQNSPQAGMARAEQHLVYAQGRSGRARLYNLHGTALDEMGQHGAALPWFERAANEFHDPIYFANLAEMYEKLGQHDLALRWAHRALAAGFDSPLCLRILREQGVARPAAATDPGDYQWTITTYGFNPNAGGSSADDLAPLETRTLRTDYGGGDGPYRESAGYTYKVLPRYLLATGVGVWPDDRDDAIALRVGPIYSADHAYRAEYSQERSAGAKALPPRGTVSVRRQSFDIRRPHTAPVTVPYLPFTLYRDQDLDHLLAPLDLENAHVTGAHVYIPYYDATAQLTHILRFNVDAVGDSERLGAIAGHAKPFILDDRPVWLSLGSIGTDWKDRSRLQHASLSFYSLDGRTQIVGGPRPAEDETWRDLSASSRGFVQSSRGVYRFHNGVWTLFTYRTIGIDVVNFPLPSGKPGPELLAGHPLVLAGDTLWIRDNDKTFRSVDLNNIGGGAQTHRLRTVRRLSQVKMRWTASVTDDHVVYLASDRDLVAMQLPDAWSAFMHPGGILRVGQLGLLKMQ